MLEFAKFVYTELFFHFNRNFNYKHNFNFSEISFIIEKQENKADILIWLTDEQLVTKH